MDEASLDNYGLYQQDGHQRGENQRRLAADGAPQGVSIADSLPRMMYGFGDDEHPLPETVACMKELVGEYVRHVTDEACKAAEVKGKLDTECFVFAVRNDKAKYKRVKELLDANVHIKNCTRLKFADDNLFTVFHPSFVPHPKVRAVVPLRHLSATPVEAPAPPPTASATAGVSGDAVSKGSASVPSPSLVTALPGSAAAAAAAAAAASPADTSNIVR